MKATPVLPVARAVGSFEIEIFFFFGVFCMKTFQLCKIRKDNESREWCFVDKTRVCYLCIMES